VTAVAFRFPAGRYHGTPWDRHANEGAVEWPPSPWRILRALTAASYKLDSIPSADELDSLLTKLSSLPVYRVPQATEAHTRHYMPTDTGTTLVFNTFVAVGRGVDDPEAELVVAWPGTQLSEAETALLDRLLEAVGYLGRSESWIAGYRLPHWDGEPNVVPAGDEPLAVGERIRLQALLPESEFEAWRQTAPTPPGRRSRLPENLREILHQDTGTLQKQGWSEPPGTHWVVYRRPEQLLRARPKRRVRAAPGRPTVARYAVSSAVLPLLTEALAVGERLREALIARADPHGPAALALFSGKDSEGQPLQGNTHAYYLPADDDQDGRIDHLIVWAPQGFDPEARMALQSLARLWGKGGHDLYLALIGLGSASEFGGLRHQFKRGICPLIGTAKVWESRTPIVLPRHPKFRRGRWIDTPEEQVMRLLAQLPLDEPLPEPVEIEPIEETQGGTLLPWYRFRRQRLRGSGRRADARGYGFRITFPEPVTGPIAIGYGAHMGLGQFVAVE
jgi:CRISPR-associated protein Csb2